MFEARIVYIYSDYFNKRSITFTYGKAKSEWKVRPVLEFEIRYCIN